MKTKLFLLFSIVILFIFSCESNVLEPSETESFIIFTVDDKTHVTLDVLNSYDVKVRTLIDEQMDPNIYLVYWDHENEKGKTVQEGLYYFRLKFNNNIVTRLDLFLFNP